MANTAVSWPGRLRQIRSFFRARSPDQMLTTAATDVAAAIAAALSYRDGLQAFTISADELAGRWSTAKARDLLAWHPRFTPPPITLPYGPLGQLARSRLTPSGPS